MAELTFGPTGARLGGVYKNILESPQARAIKQKLERANTSSDVNSALLDLTTMFRAAQLRMDHPEKTLRGDDALTELRKRVTRLEVKTGMVAPNVKPPPGTVPVVLVHNLEPSGREWMAYVIPGINFVLARTEGYNEYRLAQNFRNSKWAKHGMIIQVQGVHRNPPFDVEGLVHRRKIQYETTHPVARHKRLVFTQAGNDPEDPFFHHQEPQIYARGVSAIKRVTEDNENK